MQQPIDRMEHSRAIWIGLIVIAAIVGFALFVALTNERRGADRDVMSLLPTKIDDASLADGSFVEQLFTRDSDRVVFGLYALRFRADEMGSISAARLVEWLCSEYYVHDRHEMSWRWVCLYGNRVMEPALLEKAEVLAGDLSTQQQSHCWNRVIESLVLIRKEYKTIDFDDDRKRVVEGLHGVFRNSQPE